MALPVPVKAALRYARRVLVAFDQMANALLGGEPDQTISYRVAVLRASGSRFGCIFCRFLDLFEADHCGVTMRNRDTRRSI